MSKRKSVASKLNLEFPTKPNRPSNSLKKSILMLYGEKKIGKTDLASQFSDRMLHLMCEPMARELEIFQVDCPDYEHLSGWCDKLTTEEHPHDSVSVDTLTIVYKYAMKYAGKVKGFEHPNDEQDFGKSWSIVYDYMNAPLQKLLHSNLGVVFHSHETSQKVETRDGTSFSMIRPEGAKGVWDFINENIENIWYLHKRGNKRFLQIRGDDYAFACTAFKKNFYTKNGDQVFAIPMGNSAEEGFKNIMNAFNNNQRHSYEDFRESLQDEPEEKTTVRRKRK